jgi:hypothetical protein
MDVVTYTGNGTSQALPNVNSTPTSLAFNPDFVWLKVRSAAVGHGLFDQVRGAGKALYSHATNAEYDYGTTSAGELYQFNTGGFSIGSFGIWNVNGQSDVAWCWNAGGSTVSNTQGSITSQVRANASAGFSVVTYTGNGSNGATVGHGLGVAPQMIILKGRAGTNAANHWFVWHTGLSSGYNINLNLTNAQRDTSAFLSGIVAAPSSSTTFGFTAGSSGVVNVNETSTTYVAYCFSSVVGYSSFGSYTGNGSTDGPFVFCNFRPRWVMIKCSSASGIYWVIMDAVRNSYNVVNGRLFPNTSDPEYTNNDAMDFLSNGFKFRTVDATWNGSGNTYIYAAFAEAPFNYSRAR